jgi:uncharacterized protein (DUF3820 family)
MEVMEGVPKGHIKTLMAIKQALEDQGVVFTGAPDHRPGVYLNWEAPQP